MPPRNSQSSGIVSPDNFKPKGSTHLLPGALVHAQLFQAALQTGMHRDLPLADALAILDSDPEDAALQEILSLELAERLRQLSTAPNPFLVTQPTPYENVDGPIKVGRILWSGTPYGLEPASLTTHTLTPGLTGGGKTNLARLVTLLLTRCPGVHVLIFDRKRDFRSLLPLAKDLIVFPRGTFRTNFLRNDSPVTLETNLTAFLEILGNHFDIRIASRNTVHDAVLYLFERFGFKGGEEPCPSLRQLVSFLMNRKIPAFSKEKGHIETAINRLRGLVQSLGPVVDCDKGFALPELLRRHVVIELDGYSTEVQNLLIIHTLARIFHYRMALGERG